ncbi:MAG: pilus assembly protein PilM [Verrucomicrobiales bacterium]|nr:pilus assembly protein PilM [Verrucomicrobiales bacterium]
MQRKDEGLELLHYTVQDAPVYEKSLSPELLGEHLTSIIEKLGGKTKFLVLAIGVNESTLRPAEVPLMPVHDMRLMIKYNSKTYFQQDFPDFSFDCFILPPPAGKSPADTLKPNQKCRVLVGGAKKQHLEALQAAAKNAGCVADQVTLGIVGTVNAFELAQPENFAKGPVALVDLGFKNSTISILLNGELSLSRVVAIGGDKLTTGLSEALGISYPEAEGIKIGMPEEVQSAILPLLVPLGRELRASIDFFEHQQDRAVGQVFVSGGSARSKFVVEALQAEMMIPCQRWNPLSALQLRLPESQAGESEEIAPQLGCAIGAGLAALS